MTARRPPARTLTDVLDEAAAITAEIQRTRVIEAQAMRLGWARVHRAAVDNLTALRAQHAALTDEAQRLAWAAETRTGQETS